MISYDAYEKRHDVAYEQGRADAISEIEEAMYHQCFECDNGDLQKWDSGNWFRYKLFEEVMDRVKSQTKGEEE